MRLLAWIWWVALPVTALWGQTVPHLDSSALWIQCPQREILAPAWGNIYGETHYWVQFSPQPLLPPSPGSLSVFSHAPERFSFPLNQAVWPHNTAYRALGPWTYANEGEIQPPLAYSWAGTSLQALDPSASMAFRFEHRPVRENLQIWIGHAQNSFDIGLVSGRDTQWLSPSQTLAAELNSPRQNASSSRWMQFDHAVSLHQAQLILRQTAAHQNQLTLQALVAATETSHDGYWIYSGLPNANMDQLQRKISQSQLPRETRVVVLEMGLFELLNDRGIANPVTSMGQQARRIIRQLQTQCPQACIVLCSPMAATRGQTPLMWAQAWSEELERIAREMNCGYFNWFRISGGTWAASNWIEAQWLTRDGLAMTEAGRAVWAQAWWLAWNNSLRSSNGPIWISQSPGFIADAPVAAPVLEIPIAPAVAEPQVNPEPAFLPVYHSVAPGETLYSISKKYGCTVAQIQSLNGMGQSTQIRIGQKLRIPRS